MAIPVDTLAAIADPGQGPNGRPPVRERLGHRGPADGTWVAVAHPTRAGPDCAGGVPVRTLTAAVHLVRGATAAAVLHQRGTVHTLPGLADHDLLGPGSPVLALARSRMDGGLVFTTFLWPRGGPHAPDGHVRVTLLTCPDAAQAGLVGTVVLSPAGDLRGLTPRELEVLGLLVDGCTNQEIARTLVVAPRTVAAHLEHVLIKFDAPTRTLAAVRAEREGLLVPSFPSPCRS